MKILRALVLAGLALLAPAAARADQILSAPPRVNSAGVLCFPNGPCVGTWIGGAFRPAGDGSQLSTKSTNGTAARSLADRADDCVNPRDYRAKADLVVDANGNYVSGTDNTSYFQDAINRAIALRRDVCIPGGAYYLASGLTIDVSGRTGDSDGRPSIRGSGQSATWLRFGDGTFNALAIKGAATGAGPHVYLTLFGLRIQKVDVKGNGVDANVAALIKLDDVTISGFDIGLNGVDMLSSTIRSSNIGSNRIGIKLAKGTFSFPNAIGILNSNIAGNFETGLVASNPATLSVQGGEIGNNGCYSASATRGGVLISGGPAEGGVGFASDHVYYEANCGSADVQIVANDNPGTYSFTANTFNRANGGSNQNGPLFVTSMIKASGSAPILLDVRGNAFKRFNDYTASSSRPYVDFSGATNTASVFDFSPTNLMDDPTTEGAGLLAWKSWSPTISAVSGTLGAPATVNWARYKKVGTTLTFQADFTIPTNGSGAGAIAMTPPVPVKAGIEAGGGATYPGGVGFARIFSNTIWVYSTTALYPGGDGARIRVWGTYETD